MSDVLGVRLPDDLQEAIDRLVESSGQSRSAIAIEALRNHLDCPAQPSLENRVSRVEYRLDKIETIMPIGTDTFVQTRSSIRTISVIPCCTLTGLAVRVSLT